MKAVGPKHNIIKKRWPEGYFYCGVTASENDPTLRLKVTHEERHQREAQYREEKRDRYNAKKRIIRRVEAMLHQAHLDSDTIKILRSRTQFRFIYFVPEKDCAWEEAEYDPLGVEQWIWRHIDIRSTLIESLSNFQQIKNDLMLSTEEMERITRQIWSVVSNLSIQAPAPLFIPNIVVRPASEVPLFTPRLRVRPSVPSAAILEVTSEVPLFIPQLPVQPRFVLNITRPEIVEPKVFIEYPIKIGGMASSTINEYKQGDQDPNIAERCYTDIEPIVE
jgi:hypothetical protein